MDKLSHAQVGQMMTLAAENLRALSEKNRDLETKVASFEKQAHAEKIATLMESKGLEPELNHTEKVAGILKRDDLAVLEEAVGLTAPQMKIASVSGKRRSDDSELVSVEGGGGQNDDEGGAAQDNFAAGLASI